MWHVFYFRDRFDIANYADDFNTLTTDYKYSRGNRKNLPLPIQRQLSEKLKSFCPFFLAILELH